MLNPKKLLEQNLIKALAYGVELGKKELADQGHRASGKLEQSLKVKVAATLNGIIAGDISVETYGIYLDKGVKANRVKYNPRVLLPWIRIIKPNLSIKERMSFAYAIRAKHRKEGISTRASKRYARNGRRKGWIKQGIVNKEDEIYKIIDLVSVVSLSIDSILTEFKQAA